MFNEAGAATAAAKRYVMRNERARFDFIVHITLDAAAAVCCDATHNIII